MSSLPVAELPVAVRVVLGLGGVAAVLSALSSAVRSTVLPRSAHTGLARLVTRATLGAFRLRVGRSSDYQRRDRIMALAGPASLLNLLASWLVLLLVGFGMIYLAAGARSVAAAVELSGSSAFTLGTSAARSLPVDLVTYVEAGFGLLLLTLLITYLPSIYGAFSRREVGVNLLRARAGDPPRSATLLVRYWRIFATEQALGELWQSWETWFADVEETHSTFAVLPYFRSPQGHDSWITAAGVLLDSAAMWVAAIDHPRDAQAQLTIRTGFLALRRIAATLGISAEEDPAPDDPVSVARQEWDEAVEEMAAAGLPVLGDREAAWQAWRGWRVNYDTVLLALARAVEAPVAPWVSDRTPTGLAPRGRRQRLTRRRPTGG